MSALLLVNDVFVRNNQKYRLVHVDHDLGSAYVVPTESATPDPRRWPLGDLASFGAGANQLQLLPDPEDPSRPKQAGDADIAVRDLRWSRIKDLVSSPDVWDSDKRVALLKKHSAAIGVSAKTLRANLRQWWVGGQTQEALMGSYFRSGRIEEATPGALTLTERSPNGSFKIVFAPAKNKARGRKPKDGGYDPLAIPPALREKILEVAREHYEADACKTVRGATTVVLRELFALKDKDGKPLRDANDNAVLKDPGQRPSRHQIRYLLRKVVPLSSSFSSRNGKADFDNNHSASTGSVQDDSLGPSDVYEIDATFIDVYIVARANRKVVIGKPTLFLIIDRWSRLIVGFYITLENPSWAEATQAILSISGDWEAVCKRLGVTYDARDWPAVGVMPNRFFGDRADMITYASNDLCDGVKVQVTNAPALMSQCKPIVESGFLSTHIPLKEFAPGYEPPKNPFKRRAKKFHKDSSMTLDEMAAEYLRIVIAHNRMVKLGYQASAEEIMQNLSCTPRDIWSRMIAKRMGSAARMPINLLRRKLMPRDVAKVKVDGVHFRGCIYESPEIREWHTRASLRGTFDVTVAYTPNLVDKIIVQSPADDRVEHVLSLTTTSQEYAGYTFAELLCVQQQKGKNDRAAAHFNEAQFVALSQDLKSVTDPTVAAMKKVTKGVTPGMRLSGGDEVRSVEARQRRKSVHAMDKPDLHYGPRGADSDEQETPPQPAPAQGETPKGTSGESTTGESTTTTTAAAGVAGNELPAGAAAAVPNDQPLPGAQPIPGPAPGTAPGAAATATTDPAACGDTDPDMQAALDRLLA